MKFSGVRGFILVLLCSAVGWARGADSSVTLVNLPVNGQDALVAAIETQAFSPVAGEPSSTAFAGKFVVWESKGSIAPETIAALENFVRKGGGLLIGLDRKPGLGAVQLAFLSPTMAWQTQRNQMSRGGPEGKIDIGVCDSEMFGKLDVNNNSLPYFYPIRPFHAVERGMERFDPYKYLNFYIKTPHEPGDYSWTRTLLNRNWNVRLRGADRAASPLLLTGRYGAGRVAVFASGLENLPPGMESVFAPLVKWLAGPSPDVGREPAVGAVQISSATVVAPAVGAKENAGSLRVTVKNTQDSPLAVQVLGRYLTWENAPIKDESKTARIPAGGETAVDLPMPDLSPVQYQALDARNAFNVRIGVISESGATLLAEKVTSVDLSPSTQLDLSTDNLYHFTYPYPNAPGIDILPNMPRRMGIPVCAYAFPPGQTVNACLVLKNGLYNVAPLATITDETSPGNPSVTALTSGGGRMEKGPRDIMGYGTWKGKAKEENVLLYHFPMQVTVSGIALNGNAGDYRQFTWSNPGEAMIECDGKEVAHESNLDSRFVNENGLVYITFPPVKVTNLRVRIPWVSTLPDGKARREVQLGNSEVLGNVHSLPGPVEGNATLVLRDTMSGAETEVAKKRISVPPGGRVIWPQSVALPKSVNPAYYQLEARFDNQKKRVPLLAIQPKQTLLSIKQASPDDCPSLNFIVTRGFRNGFPFGTGTREGSGSWETIDDLIWCYSRQAKQTSFGAKVNANWLYLSNNGFGHYSNPWVVFPNGAPILDAAAPAIVETMKRQRNWATSNKASLYFGDRWDTGPAVATQYTWPEIVSFDEFLQSNGGNRRLTGVTIGELCNDINKNFSVEWAQWQEQSYAQRVTNLRDVFADAGKELTIRAQGMPLTSSSVAEVLAHTIRGMSDDNTWGMQQESVAATTGRQVALLAFNPSWKFNLNYVWGWDSAVIGNNSFVNTAGTTEPTRRHYYDAVWRGLVDKDGNYRSALAYGYGANGDCGYQMVANDFQQSWQMQERFSLIYPDAPLGAGLIVASSVVDSPKSTLFGGGGMGGDRDADIQIGRVAGLFRQLHDAGLSIPFSSNIVALRQWRGVAPLILFDISVVSDEEAAVLKRLANRGVRIAAFAGKNPPSPMLARLFGINLDGKADQGVAAGSVDGKTLVALANFLYIPLQADALTSPQSLRLAPLLQQWLALPIAFPEGTMGYGFASGAQKFVVIEDWMERSRVAAVRIRAEGARARAIGLNDHCSLDVKRDGKDWVVQVPLRPGDGEVIVLEEGK